MTSVTRISVFTHKNELGGKLWNPAIRWTNKYAVFILFEDSEGAQGIGECWCFDASPDSLVAFLRTEVLPHFFNASVSSSVSISEQLIRRATLTARHGMLSSALSGVDIALSDLQANRQSIPLSRWLNPDARKKVFVYASGGLYGEGKTPTDLATEMAGMSVEGFKLVKMKIGALEVREDLARIQCVLAALPADVNLIIDGVYSCTVESALAIYKAVDTLRVVAFQSPLAANNYAGMAELVRAGVPVMGTEAEYREELHQHLVAHRCVRFLQTAPIACGGLNKLKALDKLIADTPVKLSLEVSSTALAFLTACHFAAAFHSVAHVEYHYVHQVFFEQLALNFDKEFVGCIEVSEASGHGFKLPLDSVQQEFSIGG